ncbi:hypothetical protein [Pseudomonas sp. NPDC089547]|uniref:hypothetical protein n=1 Tax=Pseudomonas sp. NPDC089547 TaxID=3390652 RepID=UPI003D03D765
MGKRLEAVREWMTPRRRFWAGVTLYAASIVVPVVSPGTSVGWLIGPASVFIVGSFMSVANGNRASQLESPKAQAKKGFGNRVITGFFVAVVLCVAFGLYLGNTSQSNEDAEVQKAVEGCHEEADSYSGPALGKHVIEDVCRKLEVELRKPLSET